MTDFTKVPHIEGAVSTEELEIRGMALQAMMQVEELKAKVAELTRALQALQRRSHLIEQFLLFRLLDEGLTGTRLRAAKLADDRFLKYLPLVIQEDKGDIIAVRLKGSELPQSKEFVP